jgi:hypothetical protein
MGHGEQRKHPRVAVQVPVRYRETFGPGPGSYRGASTRDISAGGLRFLTEMFVPHDTPVIFEIHLPSSPKPVRAISSVAWTRALSSGVRYEVGSRFTDIIPSERKILDSFLEERFAGRA